MGKADRTKMGCGPSKDKPEANNAPQPIEKVATKEDSTGAASKKEECPDNFAETMKEFMSEELRDMMRDYFNRYDLDGSNTINSTEELKQLCTNLVVKLDLEMDVAEIDKLVESAGDMEKNNWQFSNKNASGECFCHWFTEKFNVDKTWQQGDESSDEDEPTEDHPFRTGTYIGTLEGGDKKFTLKGDETFSFKVRYDPS